MDNNKILYDKLSSQKLYTKSYDEFVNQFESPEAKRELYNALKEQNLYTKSEQEFVGQFWSKKKTRLKIWFRLQLRKLRSLLRFPKDK